MEHIRTSDSDEFGVPIHIFEKNEKEQIRISLNEYHGIEYIDIRLFFLSDDGFRPTKKGVTIRKDLYPELLNGVILLGDALGYDWKEIEEGKI
jgi:hypothetical protein